MSAIVDVSVNYPANDFIEITAELSGGGNRWACTITHISISEGCPDFELNLPRLETKIIEYYIDQREPDGMSIAKSRAEDQMGVG